MRIIIFYAALLFAVSFALAQEDGNLIHSGRKRQDRISAALAGVCREGRLVVCAAAFDGDSAQGEIRHRVADRTQQDSLGRLRQRGCTGDYCGNRSKGAKS